MASDQVWLVIPAFNEEKYLHSVLKKVSKLKKNFIVVDDGSSDNTFQIAKKYCDHALRHEINLGKGAALKTGADYAFNFLDAKAVVFFDSDDQHNTAEVELFYQKINQGSGVIFGERSMDHSMPLLRIMGNRMASVAVMFLFGRYIPDIPSGFKALDKNAYQKVRWQESGYGVELEIAARVAKNNIPFDVVPISTIYHDFERGMSLIDALKVCTKLINLKLTV